MNKIEIIQNIECGLIKNSGAIWKLLDSESISIILNSDGSDRVVKLYNWIYETNSPGCKHCGKPTKLANFFKGYQSFCSARCASNWYRENETDEQNIAKGRKISKSMKLKSTSEWEVIQSKQKQTKLEKYGDENYNNPEKNKSTMIERYGYSHALQVPEFNNKYRNTLKSKDWSNAIEQRKCTLLINTGFEHQLYNPTIKEKIRQTNLEKYGVENPSQIPEIAEKKIATHMINYGVKYPSQHPETFFKQRSNMRKFKDFLMPDGTKVKLQGYEHFELKNLLVEYNINEIIINNADMPEIWYIGEDNKSHRYYPDFYIPKDNIIIEVKSPYTLKIELVMNKLKRNRCLEMGFNFKFKIYEYNGHLLDEKEFL